MSAHARKQVLYCYYYCSSFNSSTSSRLFICLTIVADLIFLLTTPAAHNITFSTITTPLPGTHIVRRCLVSEVVLFCHAHSKGGRGLGGGGVGENRSSNRGRAPSRHADRIGSGSGIFGRSLSRGVSFSPTPTYSPSPATPTYSPNISPGVYTSPYTPSFRDVYADCNEEKEDDEDDDYVYEACVPIAWRGEVVGVVRLQSQYLLTNPLLAALGGIVE